MATATKPVKETWKDWERPEPTPLDPAHLLTRDELIGQLRAQGVELGDKSLSFWQAAGAIPYPVKIRRGRAAYAYYPPWFVDVIRELRRLQDRRKSLEEIGPILRDMAAHGFPTEHPLSATAERRDATDTARTGTAHASGNRVTGSASGTVAVTATDHGSAAGSETAHVTIIPSASPRGFAQLAEAIAALFEGEYGTTTNRVAITVVDARDVPFVFVFPTKAAPA